MYLTSALISLHQRLRVFFPLSLLFPPLTLIPPGVCVSAFLHLCCLCPPLALGAWFVGGEAGWAVVKLQGSGDSRPGRGFYMYQKVLKANVCLTRKVIVRACGFWVVMRVVNYRLSTDVCQLNELIHRHLSLHSP